MKKNDRKAINRPYAEALKFYEMILNCVGSARQILKANCAKIKVGVGEKVEN